jgi:hypothetical protein
MRRALRPPDVDSREIRTILLEVAGTEREEDVKNAGEQLRNEGEQRGLRAAIATALSARAVPLSEAGPLRIASCTDVATLMRWLQ